MIRQEDGRYVLLDEARLRREVVQGLGPPSQRRDHRLDPDVHPRQTPVVIQRHSADREWRPTMSLRSARRTP